MEFFAQESPPAMTNLLLTQAEINVLELLLEGKNNHAIAATLVLSVRTVESHISSALGKTGCESRLQLTLWWIRQLAAEQRIRASTVPSLPA